MTKIQEKYKITEDLIVGLKAQDHSAQIKFSTKYQKLLYAKCYYYTEGNVPDANIMLNKGLENIFKGISKFKETGSFEGWVRIIFRNLGRDYIKAKRRKREKEGHILSLSDHYAKSEYEGLQRYVESEVFRCTEDRNDYFSTTKIVSDLTEKQILSVIDILPHGYKMVFRMYHIDGFKHKDIAMALRINISTSKTQLRNAKISIRKQLKEKYNVTNCYV